MKASKLNYQIDPKDRPWVDLDQSEYDSISYGDEPDTSDFDHYEY
jgi:hypothetical protein